MKTIFGSKEAFTEDFRRIFEEFEGEVFTGKATPTDCYRTLLQLLREKININWIETSKKYARFNEKQITTFPWSSSSAGC